jgi:hypothetical protein
LQVKPAQIHKNPAIRDHATGLFRYAQTSFLLPDLEKQLDPRSLLFRLAQAIDWEGFEKILGFSLLQRRAASPADSAHGGASHAQKFEEP